MKRITFVIFIVTIFIQQFECLPSKEQVKNKVASNDKNLKKVKVMDYLFQVSIQRIEKGDITNPILFCGGVILDTNHILSSAHCFDHVDKDGDIRISAGIAGNSLYVKSQKLYIHPNYDNKTKVNDIALIKLENPLDLSSEHVESISLPDKEQSLNGTGDIVGWGVLTSEHKVSHKDLVANKDVQIVSNEECMKQYPDKFNNSVHICLKENNSDDELCNGYSGSSFILYQGNPKKPVIIGLSSFGTEKYNEGFMVYSNIASFLDFIADIKNKTELNDNKLQTTTIKN